MAGQIHLRESKPLVASLTAFAGAVGIIIIIIIIMASSSPKTVLSSL